MTSTRLSPSDWATIVTLYERGDKNLRDLAKQFDVSPQAIQQGLKARGIEKGSRVNEVVGEVDDAARKAREAQVEKANATRENYAKWVDVLAKLTMSKIIKASENNGSLGLIHADILTLKNGINVIEKARRESWEILGIEDLLGEGAELPDLNVGEYTPEELESIRAGNEESYLESLEDDDDFDEMGDDDSLED